MALKQIWQYLLACYLEESVELRPVFVFRPIKCFNDTHSLSLSLSLSLCLGNADTRLCSQVRNLKVRW